MNLDLYIFRAKRMDNGKWVKSASLFVTESNRVFLAIDAMCKMGQHKLPEGNELGNIVSLELYHTIGKGAALFYRVDPKTLCQYSGIDDITHLQIYEGDIVQDRNDNVYVVVRQETYFGISNKYRTEILNSTYGLKVIGNVFDDPELEY